MHLMDRNIIQYMINYLHLLAMLCLTFKKKLSESPLSTSLLAVTKGLIPPKGIRRKNIEGSELLDYVEDDLYLVDEDVQHEIESNESESDNKNGEVDEENEETQTIWK